MPTKKPAVAKPVKEKQKPQGYVNYRVAGDKPGDPDKLRSSKGFAIFKNEHTSLEEQALIDLAIANGGSAVFMAELRVIVAQEKPVIDTSGIKLVA